MRGCENAHHYQKNKHYYLCDSFMDMTVYAYKAIAVPVDD